MDLDVGFHLTTFLVSKVYETARGWDSYANNVCPERNAWPRAKCMRLLQDEKATMRQETSKLSRVCKVSKVENPKDQSTNSENNVILRKVDANARHRKRRRCDYDYGKRGSLLASEQSDSFHEDDVSPRAIASASYKYALPSSNLSALFFLDPSVFHNHNIDVPKPLARLPSYITGQLGRSQQHKEIGSRFFNTIHAWLPLVSRKRFYEDLRIHSENLGASVDLAFLLMGMKLVTWQPASEDDVSPEKQTARTTTYLETKRFGFELEASGIFSLRVLQGLLLVALYEVGHAIYPAAFMSIAACVRYAQALGIQPGGMQRLKLPLTWVEEEERKRVWWAAFLLDR